MKFLQTKHFGAFLFLITFICSANANVAVQTDHPHVVPVNSVVGQKQLEAEQEEFSQEDLQDYIASLQGNTQQESAMEQKQTSLGEYLYNTRSELKHEKYAFKQNWFVRKTSQAYNLVVTPFEFLEHKACSFVETQSLKLISYILLHNVTNEELLELGMTLEEVGIPREVQLQELAKAGQLPLSFIAGRIYKNFLQNRLLRVLTSEQVAKLAIGSKEKIFFGYGDDKSDLSILFDSKHQTLLDNFKESAENIKWEYAKDERKQLSETCKLLRESIAHQAYLIFDRLLPYDKHLPDFESNYKLLRQTHKGWKVLKNILTIADRSADILALFYENIQTQYPMPRKYKMWNNIKIGFNIAEIYTELIDGDCLFARKMAPIKNIAALTTTISFVVDFKKYVSKRSFFPKTLPTTLKKRSQQIHSKPWFRDDFLSSLAQPEIEPS